MPLPPNFFAPLIQKSKELIDPEAIYLFGSFARGDEKEKSDIDIAFKFSPNEKNWTLLKIWARENLKTLRSLDMVNMNKADEDILKSIKDEGRVLYER